jgi:hypothetical protein
MPDRTEQNTITCRTTLPRRAARPLLLIAVALLTAIAVPAARAHGGGTPQLTNEDIGPYWISVWTAPDPPREGQLHVTVAVAEPGAGDAQQAGAPVLGATVDLTLTPRSGGLADVSATATNEQSANKLFYEADVVVPAAGDWLVTVDVQGEVGTGQASFNLALEPAQDSNWLLLSGGGLLAVMAFFFYYTIRGKRRG